MKVVIFFVAIVIFIVAIVFCVYREDRYEGLKIEVLKELECPDKLSEDTGKFNNVNSQLTEILAEQSDIDKSQEEYREIQEYANLQSEALEKLDFSDLNNNLCSEEIVSLEEKLESKIVEDNQRDVDSLRFLELQSEILKKLGFSNWEIIPYFDMFVTVKNRQALKIYNKTKFLKENKKKIAEIENTIAKKNSIIKTLQLFLKNNEYMFDHQYGHIKKEIQKNLENGNAYRINVDYISDAINKLKPKK